MYLNPVSERPLTFSFPLNTTGDPQNYMMVLMVLSIF